MPFVICQYIIIKYIIFFDIILYNILSCECTEKGERDTMLAFSLAKNEKRARKDKQN